MLTEFRQELKSEITSFRLEVSGRFKEVDARFDKVDSSFLKVLAEVHRIGLMVEEQNARNKFVLDGYTSLSDRLDKVEKKIESGL
jgi:hypothetical protein